MTTDPDLVRRVQQLEQRLAVSEHLASYAYCLDFGLLDGLVAHFADDAHLDVVNFPPGTGDDLAFDGRDAIAAFYSDYVTPPSRVRGGHHVSNLVVEAGRDGELEFSAYFLTSNVRISWAQGGQYRGAVAFSDQGSRFSRLAVVSWVGEAVDGMRAPEVALSDLPAPLHPLTVARHAG